MVYKEQDFIKNINNALKYEDDKALYDILTTEIANIVAENKPELIKALQESGVSVPNDITDKALIKVSCHAISHSKLEPIKAIIKAIAINTAEWSHDLFGMIGQLGAGALNVAAEGVKASATITAAKEGTKQATITANAAVEQQKLKFRERLFDLAAGKLELKKTAMTLEAQKGGNTFGLAGATGGGSNMVFILGAVVVVSVIGIIIYKNKQGAGVAA